MEPHDAHIMAGARHTHFNLRPMVELGGAVISTAPLCIIASVRYNPRIAPYLGIKSIRQPTLSIFPLPVIFRQHHASRVLLDIEAVLIRAVSLVSISHRNIDTS